MPRLVASLQFHFSLFTFQIGFKEAHTSEPGTGGLSTMELYNVLCQGTWRGRHARSETGRKEARRKTTKEATTIKCISVCTFEEDGERAEKSI
eukprot:COSAG02_NODE_3374_length_6847_cov_15.475697_2_plen_93_part_00